MEQGSISHESTAQASPGQSQQDDNATASSIQSSLAKSGEGQVKPSSSSEGRDAPLSISSIIQDASTRSTQGEGMPSSRLLKLPRELRDLVFDYTFIGDHTRRQFISKQGVPGSTLDLRFSRLPLPTLFYVNRQIFVEYLEKTRKTMSLGLHIDMDCKTFFPCFQEMMTLIDELMREPRNTPWRPSLSGGKVKGWLLGFIPSFQLMKTLNITVCSGPPPTTECKSYHGGRFRCNGFRCTDIVLVTRFLASMPLRYCNLPADEISVTLLVPIQDYEPEDIMNIKDEFQEPSFGEDIGQFVNQPSNIYVRKMKIQTQTYTSEPVFESITRLKSQTETEKVWGKQIVASTFPNDRVGEEIIQTKPIEPRQRSDQFGP